LEKKLEKKLRLRNTLEGGPGGKKSFYLPLQGSERKGPCGDSEFAWAGEAVKNAESAVVRRFNIDGGKKHTQKGKTSAMDRMSPPMNSTFWIEG